MSSEIKVEINVDIPMRDGTVLRADIFRPYGEGPFPTLVIRSPYDKWRAAVYWCLDPIRMARNGYAVVYQDCRGCSNSDGEFYAWRNEARDGYDTVEWSAAQSWSNQRVGMYGISYLGSVQWAAAREQPPHLVAIAPGMSVPSIRSGLFRRGVFQQQLAQRWTFHMAAKLAPRKLSADKLPAYLQGILSALDRSNEGALHLPMNTWSAANKVDDLEFYDDWLKHPDNDAYWQEFELASYPRTTVPALIHGGWHDLCSAMGSISCYLDMRLHGCSEEARRYSKLLVGPWGHESLYLAKVGDLDYGLRASGDGVDLTGIHIRWFDYWLKGIANGIVDEPPVRLFVMGDNVWRTENEWPLARTQYTNYYLRGAGQVKQGDRAGQLSLEAPADEATDVFDYDPLDPVPTRGGSTLDFAREFGPLDQRTIESRADVLVYTTPVLMSDLEVTGPVTMKLFAQSSAPDTDFTAKLVDVWPGGEAYILLDGIVRARYRNGDKSASFIEPDQIYEYTIELAETCNVFKAGHRIRLEVSSSNFPKYDRNPNTGHPIGVDAETRAATQRIFHDSKHPSHLILPVIPRGPHVQHGTVSSTDGGVAFTG